MFNTPWYQATVSKVCGVDIATRFRKICVQKSRDWPEVHLECAKDKHGIVKDFLRLHCSKNTKIPYLTDFPVIFILDKMHISNKYSKSSAHVIAKK